MDPVKFFENAYWWRYTRVLDTTVEDLIEGLVLSRLGRASQVLSHCVTGRAPGGRRCSSSLQHAVASVVHGILYPMPGQLEAECLVLKALARQRGEEEYRIVNAVCATAERVIWFTESPRRAPVCGPGEWESLFQMLARHPLPAGSDPESELDAILGEYRALVEEGRLAGLAPFNLTYWLGLAYPEYYIPFSGTYCLLIAPDRNGECLRAREDPSLLGEFHRYYLRLLRTVWSLPFYTRPGKVGDWRGGVNLVRLHFLARAYMRLTETTPIAP